MMEFGIDHHGEPRTKVMDIIEADKMAELVLEAILKDLPFNKGDEVLVLVSSLGATTIMELYIFCRAVEQLLSKGGFFICQPYVGNYFTSLEMQGVTLTVM